ncbi:MAG: hypothetical protein R3Y64_10010 [Peptostreptococcaceae bacterium]
MKKDLERKDENSNKLDALFCEIASDLLKTNKVKVEELGIFDFKIREFNRLNKLKY